MMKGINKREDMIVFWNYHSAWKFSTSGVNQESTYVTWGGEVHAFPTTGFTSEVDLLKDGDECVLAVINILNLRAGSTYDVNYKIALLALVKEAVIVPFTASITISTVTEI
jgi:hypothetical protein